MLRQAYVVIIPILLASAAPAAAADEQPYKATGKWSLNLGPKECRLWRSFDNGLRQKQLLIHAWPLVNRGDLISVSPVDMPVSPRIARGLMRLGATPAIPTDVITFAGQSETQELQLYDMKFNFSDLASDEPLTLEITDDRGQVSSFVIEDGKAAVAALEKCRGALADQWGLKLKEQADNVIKPAEPLEGRNWFPSMRQSAGIVKALWQIDKDGHVSNCRILRGSGNDALDAAVCASLERHARYNPATDKSSQPVVSYDMRVFRFGAR